MNPTVFDILDGRERNANVRIGHVYLYARRSRRWIDGAMVDAFDVATIQVKPDRLQGKGHGSKFFDFIEAETASRGLIVFVESILNQRFYGYLKRRGYMDVPYNPGCLYFLPQQSVTAADSV